MLDFGFYNMDCMEGMKEFPDGYFDLAIVDPPYGNGLGEGGGCKGWFEKYRPERTEKQADGYWNRFGERFDRYKVSGGGVSRTGFHGKQYPNGSTQTGERRTMGDRPQKNHFVGCCSGTGLFRGTVPHLTEPDYLGGAIISTYRQLDAFLFGEK